MDLADLQDLLRSGAVRLDLTGHARIEAMKDGLLSEDLKQVAEFGEIVEEYDERHRVLLLGHTESDGLPCHLVLEYQPAEDFATIVTAYVPDLAQWHPNFKTRKLR